MEDVEKVKAEALQLMGVFQVIPKLVVFDLDHTLWPFYCECRSKSDPPYLFPQVKGIMHALKHKRVDLAIASKSPTPDIATTYLNKLNITSMFVAQEIFYNWGNKKDHFQNIQSKTSVPYNSMLFFDDDDKNIQGVSELGVTSILVTNGVNLGAFKEGLTRFSQNWNSPKNKNKPGK
ncbi:hypothetical protein PIB30_068476 [Stylosanthes scabra]|uniref:Magnesium-dependent phosphatase 1 n=1 Tax=Stylosanthes scabra TaxID=79078 RepID=A0ABU6ZLI6_9FABA|nr:hypothetical protein [Stylosanthes scabra]